MSNSLHLKNWALVQVQGADRVTFLQGQLTNDITQLQANQIQINAHCDPKGKLIAPLVLFLKENEDAIYYLVRASTAEYQIQVLKKYAVFSKVSIQKVQEVHCVGLTDLSEISALFPESITCVNQTLLTGLRFSEKAVILIANAPLNDIKQNITTEAELESALLEAHFPIVDLPLSEQYLPQAFNLETWHAINYKKGCYCGQEMVARAHYRGANKRSLYLFSLPLDEIQSNALPNIGDSLQQELNGQSRKTGSICALVRYESHQRLLVQVILASDFDLSQKLTFTHSNYALEMVN